jgi:hypothetical protein
MAAVFCDRTRVLVVGFMQQGTTMMSQLYYKTLKNCVVPAIQNKRCIMLKSGVVLHHDNACPRIVACT